jgi:hypothetical protein
LGLKTNQLLSKTNQAEWLNQSSYRRRRHAMAHMIVKAARQQVQPPQIVQLCRGNTVAMLLPERLFFALVGS